MQAQYLIITSLGDSICYHHTGVLCNGYVYHLNDSGVHCDPYDTFMEGRTLLHSTAATKTPDEIRAFYEENRNRRHNIVFYNCEHFANECAYGIKKSPTFDGYLIMLFALVVTIAATIHAKKAL